MIAVTFEFDRFKNEDHHKEIHEMIMTRAGLLPSWVQFVQVSDSEIEDGGGHAAIMCMPEYRKVLILIPAAFWTNSKAKREQTLTHEFMHAIIDPICGWGRKQVLPLVENEPLRKFIEGEWVLRMESIVQELTHITGQLLENFKGFKS